MPTSETVEQLTQKFKEFLLIKDPYIIKLMLAIAISQRLPCDPIWIFIIATSGSGKTEFIKSLDQTDNVWALSSITSKTLISGAKSKGGETSLLFKIQSGIITFEDITTMFSQDKAELEEIMGQFRGIYGGKFDKSFGTGEDVTWEGKITMIAGSTMVAHDIRERYGALGERFLMYHLITPDGKEAALRAMQNQSSGKVNQLREMVQVEVAHYLNKVIKVPKEMPVMDHNTQLSLIDLAEMATRARTPVEHDWRSMTKDITNIPTPESPTRFSSQLQILAQALMVINQSEGKGQRLLPEDVEILRKIALDSITRSRRRVLQELARHTSVTTAGIATKINLPTATVRRWLEELNAVDMVERIKSSGGSEGDTWILLDIYAKMFQEFDDVRFLDADLTEYSAEEQAQIETGKEIDSANNPDDMMATIQDVFGSENIAPT